MTDQLALTSSVSRDAASGPKEDAPLRPGGWWRQLLAIGLAALAIRLLFVAVTCIVFDLTPEQYAHRGDGYSYIRYARFIADQSTEFTGYDARVFPGYPLLIAPLSLIGIPTWAAALAVNIAAGAVSAVLGAVVFRDLRVGWLMAFFIPVYVASSAMAGNEAPMLAFALAGLAVAGRGGMTAAGVGGLLLGVAGIQRPVACFAVLGMMIVLARRRQWAAALLVGFPAAAVVAATMLLVQQWLGDALYGVRFYATSDQSYAGELFAWPMKSLIFTPLYQPVQVFKLPYVWMHALLAVGGTVLLTWRAWAGERSDRQMLAIIWLGLNTLYVLMIGSDWGFHALPRFLIPALPPLFLAYSGVLPALTGRWRITFWVLAAAASFCIGLYHVRST